MGVEWSCVPSIRRNTMCCVDVRTQKPVWHYKPDIIRTPYREQVALRGGTRIININVDMPAGSIEYDALVNVNAPVDTDRMLAEVRWHPDLKKYNSHLDTY